MLYSWVQWTVARLAPIRKTDLSARSSFITCMTKFHIYVLFCCWPMCVYVVERERENLNDRLDMVGRRRSFWQVIIYKIICIFI